MQIQQVNRNDAEKVYILVKNVDGTGTITTGLAVNLVPAGASIDGISAIQSTAATWKGFVGIAVQDIAVNAYGLVQSYGYCASVNISAVGSSITVTAGDTLKPGGVAGTLFSSLTDQAISTLLYRYAYVAASQTISANPSYTAAIIRAL